MIRKDRLALLPVSSSARQVSIAFVSFFPIGLCAVTHVLVVRVIGADDQGDLLKRFLEFLIGGNDCTGRARPLITCDDLPEAPSAKKLDQ